MTRIKQTFGLFVFLVIGVCAGAAQAKVRPEIMGISLEMSRAAAQMRLKAIGQLEKEDRKRQEV